MRRGLIISMIILIILLAGIIIWFIITSQEDKIGIITACTEKGCPENAIYVGSINSDKYYECDCYYAERILPENIICFTDDSDAQNKGYVRSEC